MGRIMVMMLTRDTPAIEEAFLVHKSGCLIGHHTLEENVQVDYDLTVGMLTAIQAFVKDTFGQGQFSLKNLEFENKNIMIELGENFYLAIVYLGKATTKMKYKAEEVMKDIEVEFGEIGDDWDGDMGVWDGTREHIFRLFSDDEDDEISDVEYCQLCGAILEGQPDKCPMCEFDFTVIMG